MKLSRLLLRKSFTPTSSSSSSTQPHIHQSSYLYSTTPKPKKPNNFFTKKQQQQQQNDPLPPPPTFHPRPTEIPYQAKVANSVNLIGHVAKPVQFKSSIDNKSWATTFLSQNRNADAPLWIPIKFEGDLAHVAACHLQEKDYVYIAGQLTRDPPEFAKEQGQTNQYGLQVMVNSLSFVEETLQSKERQTPFEQKEQAEEYLNAEKLGTLPQEKQDYILNKNNSTSADCEHKDHKENIRTDDLESLKYSMKTEQKSQKSVSGVKDTESSWRDLIDNPNQWWDNREAKLSGRIKPKSPDFKRKEGGDSLWLDSAPGWVRSQFEELNFEDAMSATGQKKNTKDAVSAFGQKEQTEDVVSPLGQKENTEDVVSPSGQKENTKDAVSVLGWKKNTKVDSWKALVEDPKKWWDNRSNKINPKSPDFKHKETGEALWLSTSPDWVLAELPPVRTKDEATGQRKPLYS